MSEAIPTDYERGWFDAIKRVWELCGSLELKYSDGSKELAELATLLMANRLPPSDG